jgi:hypothetical protein
MIIFIERDRMAGKCGKKKAVKKKEKKEAEAKPC